MGKYEPVPPLKSEREIIDAFTYHAPSYEGVDRHADLASGFVQLAHLINTTVPNGREKALVFTKLEEAKMHASAGVARNPSTR